MTLGSLKSGREQSRFPHYGPDSIFRQRLGIDKTRDVAADQTPANKVANQLNYGNNTFTYDGTSPPKFYGYSGTGYGGYGWGPTGASPLYFDGAQTAVSWKSFTRPFYVMADDAPEQYVTLTESHSETPSAPGRAANLQSYFEAVPVPDPDLIPHGTAKPDGGDGAINIYRPSTDELWEMHYYRDPGYYGSGTDYKFDYGAYVANFSTFNGVHINHWGSSASGLGNTGGLIFIQDVIDVLRGLPIQHALSVFLPGLVSGYVPPAISWDGIIGALLPTNLPTALGGGANPAYGNPPVDGVQEGHWYAFPDDFDPDTEMPGAGPLSKAMATAIRDYGMVHTDYGGTCNFSMEDPRVLGTPYSWAKVNPFANASGLAHGYYDAYVNDFVPRSWTDPSLPALTETMTGPLSVTTFMPWERLEVLDTFDA